MEEATKKEIQRLKKELQRRKEEIRDLKKTGQQRSRSRIPAGFRRAI